MTKYVLKLNGSFLRTDNALVSEKRFARRFRYATEALEHVQDNYPICFETGMFLVMPVDE